MEIKVNDYVRNKRGYIGKVIKIRERIETYKNDREAYLVDWGGKRATYISQIKDIKHSPNIIDILEIGDILRVFDNLSETEEKVNIFDDEMLKAVKEDIKDDNYKILSILTHEQFSSLEYII